VNDVAALADAGEIAETPKSVKELSRHIDVTGAKLAA
jgi:hypothetical protein